MVAVLVVVPPLFICLLSLWQMWVLSIICNGRIVGSWLSKCFLQLANFVFQSGTHLTILYDRGTFSGVSVIFKVLALEEQGL